MENSIKTPLLVVVGPTASGKSDYAVALAQQYNGEIISADSMQIYKYMNIATAKPTIAEQQGIPHYILDFLEPGESFSVAAFAKMAEECIADISARGKLPIVVGGTGLYIQALVDNIQFSPMPASPQLRDQLNALAAQKGGEFLLDMLREFDAASAQRLHPNNLGRIIRAIEVYKLSGITMTQQLALSRQVPSPYNTLQLGLNFADRTRLYDRINTRVDAMLQRGLLQEAKAILAMGLSKTSAQAIGYKELALHVQGQQTLAEAVEKICQESRRYAKRQITWFGRDKRIHWLEASAPRPENLSIAQGLIKTAGIVI